MKKSLMIAIGILCSIVAISTLLIFWIKTGSNSIIYATKFEYKYDQLTIYSGRTYNINKTEFNIEPKNCTENIIFTTQNTDILQIGNNGEITTLKTGEAILTATIKSGKDANLSLDINVKVINNNSSDKQTEELYFEYELSSNNIKIIEFDTGNSKKDNDVSIKLGNENIELIDIEHKRITIILKSAGTCLIEVDSPTKKILIHITII